MQTYIHLWSRLANPLDSRLPRYFTNHISALLTSQSKCCCLWGIMQDVCVSVRQLLIMIQNWWTFLYCLRRNYCLPVWRDGDNCPCDAMETTVLASHGWRMACCNCWWYLLTHVWLLVYTTAQFPRWINCFLGLSPLVFGSFVSPHWQSCVCVCVRARTPAGWWRRLHDSSNSTNQLFWHH